MPSKTLSIILGIILGLSISELLIRLFVNQNNFQPFYSFNELGLYANCYPTDPENYFPINLKEEKDLASFIKYFPSLVSDDQSLVQALQDRKLNHHPLNFSALAAEAPYCILYDRSNVSERRISFPNAKVNIKIALIGDSFAFGQGVKNKDTFGTQLSYFTNKIVFNYSQFGANIMEILNQYNQTISDHQVSRFEKIVYLYVLNDPLMSVKVKGEQKYINDLMNYRPYNLRLTDSKLEWLIRPLMSLQTTRFFLNQIVTYFASSETVQWYKRIYDPSTNPDIDATFEIISLMKEGSKKANIEFNLVIYPIMTNMDVYPFEGIHRKISKMANERGIKVIDLLPAFKGLKQNEITVHPVDFHPNARAHKIAARETASRL